MNIETQKNYSKKEAEGDKEEKVLSRAKIIKTLPESSGGAVKSYLIRERDGEVRKVSIKKDEILVLDSIVAGPDVEQEKMCLTHIKRAGNKD